MSKILAVFGATGRQGGSIINYVLNDPELSQTYKIRAITRDVSSDKAKQLAEKKVQVVHGDVLDRASLSTALNGAHTVFAMTTPSFGPSALKTEYESGKTLSDVAVSQGASYIIFSTLPAVSDISNGKYTKVTPFDAKAKVEHYIRSLPIKSAFYSPGCFMENFNSLWTFLAPRRRRLSPNDDDDDNDTWVMAQSTSPKTTLPFIDAVGDTGKFVGAILASPDKYQGTTFCAATALYSWADVAGIISQNTGKTVVYEQVPRDEFRKSLPFEPDMFVQVFDYVEEFGYYGPESKALVAWAAGNARGRLATFEECLEAHPLELV